MKTCEEMVNSLLERRAQYVSAQRKKKQRITRATVSVGSVALVSLAGFALYKNGALHENPPVTNGGAVTTTALPTLPTQTGSTTGTTGAQTADGTTTTPTTAPSKTEASKTTATTTSSKTESTQTTAPTTVPAKMVIAANEEDTYSVNESSLRKNGKYISRRLRQMMEAYEGYDVVFAVYVQIPIMVDDIGEDFLNNNEECAKLRQEYDVAWAVFNEEAKRLNPSWGGFDMNDIEVWTDTLRALYANVRERWDAYLIAETECKGPYVQSVLNERYEVLKSRCETELIDVYCLEHPSLKVVLHAYYAELTADDINALAEHGGYVFRLATLGLKDYVPGLLND